MASLNHSASVGLELDAIPPALAGRYSAAERHAAGDLASEAAAEQADRCPLVRGILIATIPALLMWAAIFELATRFF